MLPNELLLRYRPISLSDPFCAIACRKIFKTKKAALFRTAFISKKHKLSAA